MLAIVALLAIVAMEQISIESANLDPGLRGRRPAPVS